MCSVGEKKDGIQKGIVEINIPVCNFGGKSRLQSSSEVL